MKFAAKPFLLVSVVATVVWLCARYAHLPGSSPVLTVIPEEKSQSPSLTPASIRIPGGGGSVVPSRETNWNVYLDGSDKREWIWSIVHREFDFMETSDVPLRVLADKLELPLAEVIYKEHGATRILLIRQPSAPPASGGGWTLETETTVLDDIDLDGYAVKAARVLEGDGSSQQVDFTLSKAGVAAKHFRYERRWLGGKPQWRRVQ